MWKPALAGLAGALLVSCGCGSGARSGGGPVTTGVLTAGVLTGTIDLCSGLPYSMLAADDRPPTLYSAAATVVLLGGPVHWKAVRPGTQRLVFSSTVVAREHVGRNQPYRFAGVRPGQYTVRAWYTGGNVSTFRSMTLRSGQAVHADLPNLCK